MWRRDLGKRGGWIVGVAGGIALVILGGCPAPETKSADPGLAPGVQLFGAPLENSAKAELSEILNAPTRYTEPVTVEGFVQKVCQAKGCWMELATGNEQGAPSARITFENYGFFVPKDSAGALAKVEGRVVLAEIDSKHAEHLKADGGSVPVAQEVRIVARGVELHKR